eukprot:565772-Pleurochrysis_carterae.AAC.2
MRKLRRVMPLPRVCLEDVKTSLSPGNGTYDVEDIGQRQRAAQRVYLQCAPMRHVEDGSGRGVLSGDAAVLDVVWPGPVPWSPDAAPSGHSAPHRSHESAMSFCSGDADRT